MELSDETRDRIVELTKEAFPKECCGFVVNKNGKELVLPSENLWRDPTQGFVMDPKKYLDAKEVGEIICLYHSHPNATSIPSGLDKLISEEMMIPWAILAWPNATWNYYTPNGWEMPLTGRKFVHGVVDCFTLVRDYYKQRLQIVLPDFEREDDWWRKGKNYYVENFEKWGFKRVSSMQQHDVALIQVVAKVPNHAAVVERTTTPHMILHHLMNRLSCRQPYAGYLMKNTQMIVRHQSLFK